MAANKKTWIGVESFTTLRCLDGQTGEDRIVLGGVWEVESVYRGQQDGREDEGDTVEDSEEVDRRCGEMDLGSDQG